MSNDYNRSFNTPGVHFTKYWDDSVVENTNITKHRTLDTRSGATTPGYIEKAREGTLPMQPFSYRKYMRHGAVGERKFTDLVGTHDYGTYINYGDWNCMSGGISETQASGDFWNASERDSFSDLATVKALGDIKRQKVNILQDLGEARQTLSLLTLTVRRLVSSYKQFRTGNILGAAKTLGSTRPSRRFIKKYRRLMVTRKGLSGRYTTKIKTVRRTTGKNDDVFTPTNLSSLWLEFSYGWRPLFSSVQGAIDLFQQQIVSGEIIRVESKYKNHEVKTSTGTFDTYYGWKSDWVNESDHVYTVKHVVYYTVSDVSAATSSQAGLTNLPNLGWELVPFSFVVDWFINVGSWLSSLDATNGLAFVKGCKTTCYKVNSVRTNSSSSTIPTVTACEGVQVSTLRDFRLTREVLNDFPSTPWTPSFTTRSLNLQKYLTSVALLTTLVYGKGKRPLYRMR